MLPSNSNGLKPLLKLNEPAELDKLKSECSDKPIFLLFWANWDQISETLKTMMDEMPKVYQNVRLAYCDCEESELVETLDVETVQTIAVIHPQGSGRDVEKKEGIKPDELSALVEQENQFYKEWFEQEKNKIFRDIESHVSTFPFFIFVKGSKLEPKCKFTRRLVDSLAKFDYDYKTFNIFSDEKIR